MEILKEESSDSSTNTFKRKEIEDQVRNLEIEVAVLRKIADSLYETGWNAALEMAAHRMDHQFTNAFGKDTLSSIAIYLKGLKK